MAIGEICGNDGVDDRWTCPGCYDDMPNKTTGTFKCEGCGCQVECTVETQPRAVSRIIYTPALVDDPDDIESMGDEPDGSRYGHDDEGERELNDWHDIEKG